MTEPGLLAWARQLAVTPLDATRGRWGRVSALLGRQALEDAMEQLWLVKAPGIAGASARAQLLCLGSYTNEELAERVSFAYQGLTRACHHHPYELAPVAIEVEGWLDDVAALTEAAKVASAEPKGQ